MAQGNIVAIPRNKHKNINRAHATTSSVDDTRWRLVLSHAPTADFLYGVISTGIFCRTSCPSRRPRRANVRFFESASSATTAGFRACRRCRPESTDASDESPRASAEKQVRVACDYVRERKGDVQLLDLAKHVGLSPRYFHGLFKQVVGQTPGAYAAAVRQEHAHKCSTNQSLLSPTVDSGSTADLTDTSSAADSAQLTDAHHNASETAFIDTELVNYSLPPTTPDLDIGLIDFDQSQSLEWLDGCNQDWADFPGFDTESFEFWMNDPSSGSIDPSVLMLLEQAT